MGVTRQCVFHLGPESFRLTLHDDLHVKKGKLLVCGKGISIELPWATLTLTMHSVVAYEIAEIEF
jgi:hypothetical protein